MSKSSKLRPCPALGRDISPADCGEPRQSRLACPADCPHNPFGPAHYSQLLEIEDRLDTKSLERLAPMLGVTFKLAKTAPLYGVTLLLAYGVGHCAVIVAAGTSTEMVQRFLNWNEKSRGVAMVKIICGVLVLLCGVWLIYSA
jgi:hypothetical protein